MTRELKRITAIRGLKCCIESDENVFCPDDCPYSDTFGDNSCEANLHKELLEFVKPRVMTKEDLADWEGPVWLESQFMGKWALILHANEYFVELIYDVPGQYGWKWETYGETWRCWTYKPLPGQSEAHPWKEWPE